MTDQVLHCFYETVLKYLAVVNYESVTFFVYNALLHNWFHRIILMYNITDYTIFYHIYNKAIICIVFLLLLQLAIRQHTNNDTTKNFKINIYLIKKNTG